MEVTSRWWATAGAGLVLVAIGIVAERPILLVAAAGVGSWLVGVAVATSRVFARVADRIAIDHAVSTTDTFVERDVSVTLAVRRSSTTMPVPLSVRAGVPVGADRGTADGAVSLGSDDTEGDAEFDVSFPVAGRFSFPTPTVRMSDPTGLYRATFDRGPRPTVTVRSQPLDVHVGRGGEAIRNAYGDHESDRPGPGVTTQEIRRYVPGDDLRRIDWKATARLADVYVRETQGETDRRTSLIVDHRGRMSAGATNETMLDHAREVAIGVVRTAADRRDPLALETVGDGGVTGTVRSSTTTRAYALAESTLYDLEPTAGAVGSDARSPSRAKEIAGRIAGDDDFARVLDAYVGDPIQYVRRIRDDPLLGSVRRVLSRNEELGLTVIVTSDDEPVRLREAITTVVGGGGRVLVFITPRCLFESTDLAALNDVYDRYLEFERFRRDLDAHPRVTALEIAPESRIDAVLAHRRDAPTAVR
ncbi:DUF58 domain-containing protein [Halorubrum halodurans]|jgi:uncharacterized protein (DUF58 family)|uniref:DUF58 domain-containing protein n=1 Tax=Halorubrum halodurans TaxID=1383851 RepID=A0A256IJA2_9EURY|nr:DUF58 domain-containing protein [Halorubrum halodurans]OYR56615.1 DUF58 domain-containing protein [Halorubrum halodurans]